MGVGNVEVVMLVEAEESGVRDHEESSVRADRSCVLSTGVLPDRRREREICFASLGMEPWLHGITRGASCFGESGCLGAGLGAR